MKPMITYSGEAIFPFQPDITKIKIEDIAHSLSFLCRGNGHYESFFSVAQHSLNCLYEAVARGHSKIIQLACLLHDGSEAFLGDIIKPVKSNMGYMEKYVEAELHMQNLIYQKFTGNQLTDKEHSIIKQIDDDMLVCELNELSKLDVTKYLPVTKSTPSFDVKEFSVVKDEFLHQFHNLRN